MRSRQCSKRFVDRRTTNIGDLHVTSFFPPSSDQFSSSVEFLHLFLSQIFKKKIKKCSRAFSRLFPSTAAETATNSPLKLLLSSSCWKQPPTTTFFCVFFFLNSSFWIQVSAFFANLCGGGGGGEALSYSTSKRVEQQSIFFSLLDDPPTFLGNKPPD